MSAATRLILELAFILLALASAASAGWYVNGLRYEQRIAAMQADQHAIAVKVEAADNSNTRASSERVDAQEQAHQIEVQYVDREVIRYVTRPGVARCNLSAGWVRLYNHSSGLPDGVPAAGATGPATADAAGQPAGAAVPGH